MVHRSGQGKEEFLGQARGQVEYKVKGSRNIWASLRLFDCKLF
jgi:hypothetical protein